ncbi:hypothetical protein CBR_g50739 [Chara braunii]|uniref:fructose-bisphosphatase n=1 Tax=Chara braunii TaxID=69332 RepID=A0A388K5P9_CHABU|nr:hypothetical protein CBR_g50739 [Chara braunii]|eukprot:GBG65378.1 hypothetical protein CBR_g50739 [Chara braunii]
MTAMTSLSLPPRRQVSSPSMSVERRTSGLLCSTSGGKVSIGKSFGVDIDHTRAMAPSRRSASAGVPVALFSGGKKQKFIKKEDEPKEYWQTADERSGKSPLLSPISTHLSIKLADVPSKALGDGSVYICVAPRQSRRWSPGNQRTRSVHMAAVDLSESTAVAETKLKLGSGLLKVVGDECKRDGGLAAAGMVQLFAHIQLAVKSVSSVVSRASLEGLMGYYEEVGDGGRGGGGGGGGGAERDKQKKLDVVANDIVKRVLADSGVVAALASEEDEEPVFVANGGEYVVVFDPLDGSRNIDASIPTGMIFGVYARIGTPSGSSSASTTEWSLANSLQPGSTLLAGGYALFSSATMLVLSLGHGTHGFTLDTSLGEFLLTHPNIQIPKRGQIYSVNDGRYFDWPQGLRNYIDDIRQGKGQNPKKYSARYICSLVADVHRTLLYGGIAMNPRSHLRLVYECNPMGFIVEQAGGKASDGKRRIVDIKPSKLHERLPLFLGSFDDVHELESYGDVQQVVNPGYQV